MQSKRRHFVYLLFFTAGLHCDCSQKWQKMVKMAGEFKTGLYLRYYDLPWEVNYSYTSTDMSLYLLVS